MGIEEESDKDRGAEMAETRNRFEEAFAAGGTDFPSAFTLALDDADLWAAGKKTTVPVPWAEWGRIMAGSDRRQTDQGTYEEPGELCGLLPGLHIIAAGTGVGKTALAAAISACAASAGGLVAYFALELSAAQVAMRLAAESKFFPPWSRASRGRDRGNYPRARLEELAKGLTKTKIQIYTPSLTADSLDDMEKSIAAVAEAMRGLSDLDGISVPPLLVLDYVQIVGLGDSAEARGRVGRIAGALREAARRHDIAIVAISSVARAGYETVGARGWVKGGLAADGSIASPNDLLVGKESGDIEFFSDTSTTVLVVNSVPGGHTQAALAVAKNRNGSIGWAPCRFRGGRWLNKAHDGDSCGQSLEETVVAVNATLTFMMENPLARGSSADTPAGARRGKRGKATISNEQVDNLIKTAEMRRKKKPAPDDGLESRLPKDE